MAPMASFTAPVIRHSTTWPDGFGWQGYPAIHRQNLPGDPIRLKAAQKPHRMGDIFASAQPPAVDTADQCGLSIRPVTVPLRLCCRIGQHETGGDRIDRYPLRPQFRRQLPCQPDQRVFGRGIGLNARQTGRSPAPELIVTLRPHPARFIAGAKKCAR